MSEFQELVLSGQPMSKVGHKVTVRNIKLKDIKISRNSRMNIDPEELAGLMASIKEEGLLQPIGVVKTNGHFEICYGNRRYLACSRLGLNNIPCIVHDTKELREIDLKNLTENVQRRNISLIEVGRYCELLTNQGLTQREIAVRMGTTEAYIRSCLLAFEQIPKQFQKDLQVRIGKDKGSTGTKRGQISIRTAQKIVSAEKSGLLNSKQMTSLLREARDNPEFNPEMVQQYVGAMSAGAKDPIKETAGAKNIVVKFVVPTKELERLFKKHITDGPFSGMAELCKNILEGKVSERIKIIKAGM